MRRLARLYIHGALLEELEAEFTANIEMARKNEMDNANEWLEVFVMRGHRDPVRWEDMFQYSVEFG